MTRVRFASLIVGALVVSNVASAATMKTLYKFSEATKAYGSFVVDDRGFMYGAGTVGGAVGYGTVFRFDPKTKHLMTLYTFAGGADGANPVPGMVLGKNGILYGATAAGGTRGVGTIFSLDTRTGAEQVLHSFGDGADGKIPQYGPIFGADGKLYGTTPFGGAFGYGAFYRVNQSTRNETIIFSPNTDADAGPNALTLGPSGLLYGTSHGEDGVGTLGNIFAIDPVTGTQTILCQFTNEAIEFPTWAVTLDKQGTIYGTGADTAFQFNPSTNTLTQINSYQGGNHATGRLLIDGTGSLYGTAQGDDGSNFGIVYKYDLTTKAATRLYQFNGALRGQTPSGIVFGKDGNLYGTTLTSGNKKHTGFGTIFSVLP